MATLGPWHTIVELYVADSLKLGLRAAVGARLDLHRAEEERLAAIWGVKLAKRCGQSPAVTAIVREDGEVSPRLDNAMQVGKEGGRQQVQ